MANLYDAIKDVAKIVQKAGNIDLYKQLLDIGAESIELQNKVYELTKENNELKKKMDGELDIERHEDDLYITLKDDPQKIRYCSTCWGSDHKLIQILEGRCWVCEKRWYEAGNHK